MQLLSERSWPQGFRSKRATMPANEYYPCFPGCARLAPSALPFFEANMSRAAEAAGDKLSVYRETPVIKLLKDNAAW